MHTADPARPRPARAAAALASDLALVSGLAAAGCAVSSARAASPASLGPVTYLTGHPH